MQKLTIVCVDDQREVLAAMEKDLAPLTEHCTLEICESADEAEELLDELDAEAKPVAVLICDHVMPGKNGVDFLIEVNRDPRFKHTRKLLLTGMATHQDTIVAINKAQIDRYVEKPWQGEQLLGVVKTLLTQFVLNAGLDYQTYLPVLDQETLYEGIRR